MAERAAGVVDAATARAALREPSAALLRALARRIDELRFQDPLAAFEVAEVALRALDHLPPEDRRPALRFALSTAYGSACRATARFEAAERALLMAARVARRGDARQRAEVADRLAYLRADQGREAETRMLIKFFLDQARPRGGAELGRRLTDAASIMTRFRDYGAVAEFATEALVHLPPNGDRYHLAALADLARARLGSPGRKSLLTGLGIVERTLQGVDRDSFPWLRLHWIAGNLLRCRPLRRHAEALDALEIARAGIDRKGDPFDRALLVLDLAELHLDRGVPDSARDLARESFGVLNKLRNWPEAYRALRTFYRAATELKLEPSVLDSVRQRLLSARR
ncbi:MAG: hypothetical protein GY719_34290 [bacterium]|nr:hypothetical protein [bacterium]